MIRGTCSVSYKGLVAEALRQLVGEQNYKQDEVLPPGYYTGTAHEYCTHSSTQLCLFLTEGLFWSPDFVLWMDGCGRILPIRTGTALALSVAGPAKPAEGAVAVVTSEFQKFSPFAVLEGGAEQACNEAMGGPVESRSFLPHHIRSTATATATPGANGGHLDYGQYYVPAAEYYSTLPKEHSLESQDSSTLSSPPSDSLAQPGSKGTAGASAPDSLFQFSIGKILEDEGGSGGQEAACELPGFYEAVADREPPSPPQLHPPSRPDADKPPTDQRQIRR